MKKKAITHLTAITAVFLCFALIFGSAAAFAADTRPDESITKIVIKNQSGVLEGETLQLTATVDTNRTFFDSVEWSSNNPNVISCTKDGKITGLVAGKSAKITCKAKYGKTSDEITVYCVKKLSAEVKTDFRKIFTLVYPYPGAKLWKDLCFNATFIGGYFQQVLKTVFGLLAGFDDTIPILKTITVCGKWGNYAYIRYGENNERDGFVESTKLKNAGNNFLKLSATDMCVWADGIQYESRKLTTGYKGDIQWTVEHENDYLRFDRETGQVTGLVPGKTATITATADGETATCTIHLLYEWPQPWTAKTNRNTNIYYAVGNGYSKGAALSKNTEFVVEGDCGTNDGWAYGYISGTETWGFVPVSHISTKGTVSQYKNMTTTITENGKEKEIPWVWPVKDEKNGETQSTKARYISSPYGWRDTDPAQHKGVDITNGISSNKDFANSVDGYEVVSAFAGKVIYVYDISSGHKSCGNCVAIRSNKKDPVTGKYLVAIYMHLKSKPSVRENQEISVNTLLGYVGSTGKSDGSHLHFEVNNQNLSYGQTIRYENNSDKEMVFGSVINPLFFYMNYYNLPESNSSKIKINPTCDAMDYRKPLWYGDDIKEDKEP